MSHSLNTWIEAQIFPPYFADSAIFHGCRHIVRERGDGKTGARGKRREGKGTRNCGLRNLRMRIADLPIADFGLRIEEKGETEKRGKGKGELGS